MGARATRAMVTAAAVLALAGCSQNPTTPTQSTTAAKTSTPAPTPAPGIAACASVAADQLARSVGADTGAFAVPVSADNSCTWTAAATADFLQVLSGTSGTGTGDVQVGFKANSTTARTGTVTVGGSTITVTQAAPPPAECSFKLSATALTVGANPSPTDLLAVDVTETGTCYWTAISTPFVQVGVNGYPGDPGAAGSGRVYLSVMANSGAARTASVVIASQTVTISQDAAGAPACSFSVSPTTLSVSSAAQTVAVSVKVTQGSNCAWTARSTNSFLDVPPKSGSGVGDGTATVTIPVNTDAQARSGNVIVAGQVVVITQDAANSCITSISPEQQSFRSVGGTGTITVTAPADCTWSAYPTAADVIVDTAPHSGSAVLPYTVKSTSFVSWGGTILFGTKIFTYLRQDPAYAYRFSYSSDPGEVIGEGTSGTYTGGWSIAGLPNDVLGPTLSLSLSLVDSTNSNAATAKVTLAAPAGQNLAVGYYDNAARAGYQQPDQAGLDFTLLRGSYQGVCSDVVPGRFQILANDYDSSGYLLRRHILFELHCRNASAGVTGEYWVAQTTEPAAPPASLPNPGPPTTFLSLTSDPGEPFLKGGSLSLTRKDVIFLPSMGKSAEIWVMNQTWGSIWQLDFQAPGGGPPPVGTYQSATKYPSNGSGPQMFVDGLTAPCDATGTFTVLESVVDSAGNVLRFHATFEQHCGAAPAALRGEIYVVANPWR